MRKIKFIIILLLILLLLVGCWDMVEINERIFPYTIGIDLHNKDKGGYIVTFTYPNINAIGKNSTQEDMVFTISTEASSIFEGSRMVSDRLAYPLYFKHLKVLVIGEELAKDSNLMRQTIDSLNRDFKINLKVQLGVARGTAKDLLENKIKSKKQQHVEGVLYSILKENKRSTRFKNQNLVNFIQDMDMNGSSLASSIAVANNEVEIKGASIFKDYKLIGFLDEKEVRGVLMSLGQVREEIIDTTVNGIETTYAVTGTKAKKKLLIEEGNMIIKLLINTEGSLQGYKLFDHPVLDDEELIIELEEALGKEIKIEIQDAIETLQKTYNADVIGISEYLFKYHPKVWKSIEKDWNEIFPNLTIDVEVNSKIRRRGLVN